MDRAFWLRPLYLAGTALLLLSAQLLLRKARGIPWGVSAVGRAWRFYQVGEVTAAALLAVSVARSCAEGVSPAHDVFWCAAFGLGGLALLELTSALALRSLFGGGLRAELDRGNVSAGLVAASHILAAGLLIAPAAAGRDLRSLGVGLVFAVLALLTHLGALISFRAITSYDDAEQVRGENVAAALSYAGLSLAVALVIARAVEGDFVSWRVSLLGFARVAARVAVLYPVRQLVVQGLLLGARPTLRGGALDQAIGVERELPMAALEAATYVAAAVALVGV